VKILFVDGHCLICNRLVNIVLNNDNSETIKISHLQGEYAKDVLPNQLRENISTVVYIDDGVIYKKSDAAIRVCSSLNKPWSFLAFLKIIPKPIRDYLYMVISFNRYRIGKKLEACPIPPKEFRARFLP